MPKFEVVLRDQGRGEVAPPHPQQNRKSIAGTVPFHGDLQRDGVGPHGQKEMKKDSAYIRLYGGHH